MQIFDPDAYRNVRKPLLDAETLPTWCYTSDEFYQREVETIFFKVWNFIGRADYIPNPGDYFTLDFTGVPLLVARGNDGQVRAFSNSCRHRGSKVAVGEGNCKNFRCPYHGWTYAPDGRLIGTPGMLTAHDFDASQYPLVPIKLETWGGFLFVNFDPDSDSLTKFLGDLPGVFESYDMENLRCTRRKSYEIPCNWKIYVENAMEAFHVPHVHKATINQQKGNVKEDRTFDATRGNWVVMHKQHEGSRAVLLGEATFPRIPTLAGKAALGTFYPLIYPSTMLGCTVDCVWFLEIHPLGPAKIELVVGSCFPKEITERADFEEIAKNYYKRWDLTTAEDLEISVLQQEGISSPFSRPGRLSEHEPLVHAFDNWVLDHVLGVVNPTPTHLGFRVQDLDVAKT
jgi:phenylpropionate dioxygenase-like ring-hydroxylating dioxygenase large terminal subunit